MRRSTPRTSTTWCAVKGSRPWSSSSPFPDAGPPAEGSSARDLSEVRKVAGLTWKQDRHTFHNPDRPAIPPGALPVIPYDRLADMPTTCARASSARVRRSIRRRLAAASSASSAASSRCGTARPCWRRPSGFCTPSGRSASAGAPTACSSSTTTSSIARRLGPHPRSAGQLQMPWWCYARTDALAGFAPRPGRRSAGAGSAWPIWAPRRPATRRSSGCAKGPEVEHTLEVARRCREYGVIPEFSFVLGGPDDPEGEIEETFEFVRRLKDPESGVGDRPLLLQPHAPAPELAGAGGRRHAAAAPFSRATAPRDRRSPPRPRSGRSRSGCAGSATTTPPG